LLVGPFKENGNKVSCKTILGPPVSSTNKTDCHDITERLLKVALNTINQTKPRMFFPFDFNGSLKNQVLPITSKISGPYDVNGTEK